MIDFGTAVRRYYANYVVADGRSQRSAYWWVVLYQVIIYTVLAIVIFMAEGGSEILEMFNEVLQSGDPTSIGSDLTLGASGVFALILMVCFALANLLPDIMLRIRRFHDLGQTGWLVLVFMVAGAFPVVGILADIANFIWFIFRGTAGPNKYGPDPLGHDPDVFG